MKCKYCGSENLIKKGFVAKKQLYKCKDCGHRFYDNENFAKMKVDKKSIVLALNLYYDGLSLRKTQRNLEQIFGLSISQVTILNWIKKYSKLVQEYVMTFEPELSGKWHEDETLLKCEGKNIWFWEMIDEETKFIVASHVSGTRTLQDTITIFQKGRDQSKKNPKAVFVDGCNAYNAAFNKVFYSRYKAERVELIQRVGIRSRETNNIVERLHGTLKDRTRVMRGLKDQESTKAILEGYAIHYNYIRPHQSLKGKTPAQVAGIQGKTNWKSLIEEATKYETRVVNKALGCEEALPLKQEYDALKVMM
jgi:transposase-like protein